MNYVLVINPGSTSTKIAVYRDKNLVFEEKIVHTVEELSGYNEPKDELDYRKDLVLKALEKHEISKDQLAIVMGRGGLIYPVESGVYAVTDKLKHDLEIGVNGKHASNLGGLIAKQIADSSMKAKAYIADPVVVDELHDIARVTGHPLFKRKSIFHALNHKAVARQYAKSIGKSYEELNLVVAHMGGGISIAAHREGKVIDVNQALDGEGPLSPERSGTLPVGDLIDICFSNKFSKEQIKKMIVGKGGWMAYLETNDSLYLDVLVEKGDKVASTIREALAYQTSKFIGAMATVLKGKVDAVILTGGLAQSRTITELVKDHVSYIAPVNLYPGENEMESLAMNAFLLLEGKVQEKVY